MTDQTARDLRNAALVVEHAGWAREDWITQKGRVCLDGALEIACGVTPLVTEMFDGQTIFTGLYPSSLSETNKDAVTTERDLAWFDPDSPETQRQRNARDAVAKLIPPCACNPQIKGSDHDAQGRVIHFNDYHCTGGDDAELLLIQAAEKLEAEL